MENQIAQNDPPEVETTLKRLMAAGDSRHEAVHEIASVSAAEVWAMLKQKCPFDSTLYVSKLKKLGRKRKKHSRRKR